MPQCTPSTTIKKQKMVKKGLPAIAKKIIIIKVATA
jgi:hypothetical protein